MVSQLGELQGITFPRAAKPKEEVVGKPMLLIFGDGSTAASCALAYLRWQMSDGTVQCRLLAGKTRVAPKCKISIPRMELVGALLAVRLARKIRDSLQMELEAVRYFTDSTAVLGMILRESATYQEFVGTRVSEIRTKSDLETEWFWIPGELNIADMGTRPTVLPGYMGLGTPYQEGLPWMRESPEAWPTKKDGCVRTVRVQYTNPGKAGGMTRSPPKITTRPIHKIAMMVPVEYAFEDEAGDNEVGPRGRKCDLGTKRVPGATEAPGKGLSQAVVREPEAGGRKRRGRPKKSERSTGVGHGPQTGPQDGPSTVAGAEAPPEVEDQPPTMRRGCSRDLGPRGQRDRGRSC